MYGQGRQFSPLRSRRIDPRPCEMQSPVICCRAKPQPEESVSGYYMYFLSFTPEMATCGGGQICANVFNKGTQKRRENDVSEIFALIRTNFACVLEQSNRSRIGTLLCPLLSY
jgi:hypothetical protein